MQKTVLSKKEVFDRCTHQLNWHGSASIQKSLMKMVDYVDPHLKADTYGQGEVIERFEEKIALFLGKEAAKFMPSGTMAQQIAARVWADRKGRPVIGMHPTCHMKIHENDAYAELHHLRAVMVGDMKRVVTSEDLKKISESSSYAGDYIGSPDQMAVLVLELPQRHNGGVLPAWAELLKMRKWADAHDVILHMDGARLWECGSFYKKPLSEIAALFDSVYVSFYKGLGGMGGAMLLGSRDLISQSKVWLRRHGGDLIHLYPFVLSADVGFESYLPLMPQYFERAVAVAKIIKEIPVITLEPEVLQTNIMHLSFRKSKTEVEAAALAASRETGLWILHSLWERQLQADEIFELYIGDAALGADLALIEKTLKLFGENLESTSS